MGKDAEKSLENISNLPPRYTRGRRKGQFMKRSAAAAYEKKKALKRLCHDSGDKVVETNKSPRSLESSGKAPDEEKSAD